MQLEFKCLTCGSPAVEFPNILRDDALVKCQRSKVNICSLGEFRRRVNWLSGAIASDPVPSDDALG
jgi:hypothetical protein